jgi:Tol biopolymer transport system component
VGPASDIEQGRPITPVIPDGVVEMVWTPDGKIVHTNGGIGKSDIWIMGSDGGGQRQLTSTGNNRSPSVSTRWEPDSFSFRSIGTLQCLDHGDRRQRSRQLTHGSSYASAVFSADGKWIFFSSLLPGSAGISKVSVEGGDPVRLAEGNYGGLAVSPDGKLIAAKYVENRRSADQRPDKIAILPVDGGIPIKSFGIRSDPTTMISVIWSADGKGLIFKSGSRQCC